jgi:hypothetical protein
MNPHASVKNREVTAILVKADPTKPAIFVTGPNTAAISSGIVFGGVTFTKSAAILLPKGGLKAGCDYAVAIAADGSPTLEELNGVPADEKYLGGFHFAPGSNASARAGGDAQPAINPYSVWDINFRPACPDPRGMALVETPRGRCWVDIYLTGVDHLTDGTSKFGAAIADGSSKPANPAGGRFSKFDYEAACAIMKHHGKGLLSLDEFFAAAFGVTEKTSCGRDPKVTGIDVARTSKFGLMQATGNMWIWGHDGDPDEPRASIFGGSWLTGDSAGSRYAFVAFWPDFSDGYLGARGRSDHLQLA